MSFSILCTGSSGLVASDFKIFCKKGGIPFYGLDIHGEEAQTDITNKDSLYSSVVTGRDLSLPTGTHPILFHFAAITLTGRDLAQEQIDLSRKVNVDATKNILEVCKQLNIPLVHISTDFVFSGACKDSPYLPDDELCPDDSIYSQTKAEAERLVKDVKHDQHVTVIRLAFPYGNFSHPKPCLVRKMLSWMDTKSDVDLYSDQHICPTPIEYFSQCCLRVAELMEQNKLSSGKIMHCVGRPTTPYEFGENIKNIFGKSVQLHPTSMSGGAKNLVLDTKETEELLHLTSPEHKESLAKLKAE